MWFAWTRAWAADPPLCADLPAPPSGRVAVVWFSPLRRRATMDRPLDVFAVADVDAFVDAEPSAARLLQWTGQRRRDRDPRRPWKAVVFDAPGDSLAPGGTCGAADDLGLHGAGATAWRSTWRDLAADGFCVVPLARWIDRQRRGQASAGR